MSTQLPDYYRQFAEKRPPDARPRPSQAQRPNERPEPQGEPPSVAYEADSFSIKLYEEWQDKTVYVLGGPATDDVQHNITVTVGKDVEVEALIDFADWQVKSLEQTLKGCRLLLKDRVELLCGLPAYRAVFVWYPAEEKRIYQEQLYVLYEGRGYTLTASFTKKTFRTLGPRVEALASEE